jgi:hypothetical protein
VPRLLSSLAVLGVVTPVVVAMPVATPTVVAPRAVQTSVAHVALTPVAAPVTAVAGPALRRAALGIAQTPTKRFTTLGVTWKHDPSVGDVTADVRWRAGGRWSAWRTLSGESDDAPDAGSTDITAALRDGTAPLWVGPADGVQVRTSVVGGVAARDLRVDLVDPGTSAADAGIGAVPRDAAAAVEAQPSILTRQDWGADESIRRGNPSYNATVKVGFVHHTDTANDYSQAQTAAMIRSIYAYHVKSNGWSDIGYNYLVDRFGRVWEGRAGGLTRAVVGAHTGGFNTDSFGTSLLGTYTSVAPSTATLTALEQLFAWKLGSYYRDPAASASLRSAGGGTSKYPAGVTHTFAVVSGHRDAGNTSCPGDATYARMGAIRTAINGFLGTAFVNPVASATRVPLGSTTPIKVSATARNAPSWTLDITTTAGAPVRSFAGTPDQPISASWDLTDAAGVPVPPGSYTLRLQGSSLDGDTALPWTSTVLIGSPSFPKGSWMNPRDYSSRFGSG